MALYTEDEVRRLGRAHLQRLVTSDKTAGIGKALKRTGELLTGSRARDYSRRVSNLQDKTFQRQNVYSAKVDELIEAAKRHRTAPSGATKARVDKAGVDLNHSADQANRALRASERGARVLDAEVNAVTGARSAATLAAVGAAGLASGSKSKEASSESREEGRASPRPSDDLRRGLGLHVGGAAARRGANSLAVAEVANAMRNKAEADLFGRVAEGAGNVPIHDAFDPNMAGYMGRLPEGMPSPHAQGVHIGKNRRTAALLAHELGHASIDKKLIGSLLQTPAAFYKNVGALGGLAAGLHGGLKDNEKSQKAAIILPIVGAAPQLLSEAGATALGFHRLQQAGASKKQLVSAARQLGPAFLGYVAGVAPNVGAGLAGVSAGKAMRASKEKQQADAADKAPEKEASVGKVLKRTGELLTGSRAKDYAVRAGELGAHKAHMREVASELGLPFGPAAKAYDRAQRIAAIEKKKSTTAQRAAGLAATAGFAVAKRGKKKEVPAMDQAKVACARELLALGAVADYQAEALVKDAMDPSAPAPAAPGITREEAERALTRLRKLESSKPTVDELKRGTILGAAASPVATVASRAIGGDPLLGQRVRDATSALKGLSGGSKLRAAAKIPVLAARNLGASATMGAFFGGGLPAIKSEIEREAERSKLRAYLGQQDTRGALRRGVSRVVT